MRSFVRAGAALLMAAPFGSLMAQAAPVRIAYVNSRDILNSAPGAAVAQGILQREVAAMEAQVKRMSDSLDALTSAFNKDQATLVGEKRDARLKAISDRQGEYQQRFQALQAQAQDRETELMQPVLDQVKLVLEDLRVEMGYTFIFDIAQGGTIVAADKNLNISDRVIAKLRGMPVPTVLQSAAGSGAAGKADPAASKAPAGPPAGAPVAAPAGVRGPGTPVPAGGKRPDSATTKKADSATAKKADSTSKKVDTLPVKRPPQR